MKGMSLRTAFLTIDPDVRFTLTSGRLETAKRIGEMRRIPGDMGVPIYLVYEDEAGYVYVGIAPSEQCDAEEWRREQMETPLFKSVDRVDMLGVIIRPPDTIGGAD